MSQDVFLVRGTRNVPVARLNRIARALYRKVKPGNWGWGPVMIKVHVGEISDSGEISTHMRPDFVRAFASVLQKESTGVFATDSTVNYSGTLRSTPEGHMEVAKRHGFTTENIGIPFMVADQEGCVTLPSERFGDIEIPKLIYEVGENGGSMLVLSHFKAHEIYGFGGALKNLGMGFVGRKTKADIHHFRAQIDAEKCKRCGECVDACTHRAIDSDFSDSDNPKVWVDQTHCLGCMACLSSCKNGALRMNMGKLGDIDDPDARERIGRHITDSLIIAAKEATNVFQEGHLLYVTDLTRITAYCDCDVGARQKLIEDGHSVFLTEQDIGYLASRDPVALDQACLDLVMGYVDENEWHRRLSVFRFYFPVALSRQTEKAEELGMGSRQYELQEMEIL